ncbi:unnamed protein product [Arctogadus glacialis]
MNADEKAQMLVMTWCCAEYQSSGYSDKRGAAGPPVMSSRFEDAKERETGPSLDLPAEAQPSDDAHERSVLSCRRNNPNDLLTRNYCGARG